MASSAVLAVCHGALAEEADLPGLGDEVNRSTSPGFLSATTTKDGFELANATAIPLSPNGPILKCPNLEEVCLTGHKCPDRCAVWSNCPTIVGNVCDEVRKRNTGVTCNLVGCSWSGVYNAYCGGKSWRTCLCNKGWHAHNGHCCEDSWYAAPTGVCP